MPKRLLFELKSNRWEPYNKDRKKTKANNYYLIEIEECI
jgi:hypothetical protein